MSIKLAHITTADVSLKGLLLNQLLALREAGYDVTGISSPGNALAALDVADIRHIPVTMKRNVNPLSDIVALWKLYWIMRRERFTIVHVHTPKAELLGALAARLAGVPIVVDTFRGIYYRSDMHPFWRWLFLRMAQLTALCSDVVLSQSREAMEMAIQEGGCPSSKIKPLGNGIDVRRFDRQRVPLDVLTQKRAELGIPQDSPVIGFVGRLVAEKGILELLAAAPAILQHHPQARFLFVGEVDSEKPDALTPQIAHQYNVAHACIFAGRREDMPELFALMDVFVLPSQRESFPRSPMEAASMQVPCVVTDIPGCREVVEHERNGLLVPLGNVNALSDAVLQILGNKAMAARMGQEGRKLALERFDEQLVFEKVKAEYARLLMEKGLPIPTEKMPSVCY